MENSGEKGVRNTDLRFINVIAKMCKRKSSRGINLTSSESKPTLSINKTVAIAVIGIVAVVIVLFAFALPMFAPRQSGTTSPYGKITQVLIKVEYGGQWQGAYGDTSGISSWSGTGSKTVTLNRPSDASIWTISANAQKMDGSTDTLRIMITKTDGTILKEGSTSAAYGVAQIIYSVQD